MTEQLSTKTGIEQPEINILELNELEVYFELKKFGFQHAGYVRAVDGVSMKLWRVKRSRSLEKWQRQNQPDENHPAFKTRLPTER